MAGAAGPGGVAGDGWVAVGGGPGASTGAAEGCDRLA